MPHFKDNQNNLYFLDDASYAHLLPTSCVQITDEEAEVLRQPPPETPEQIITRLEGAIDRYLDAQAQSFRYESIRTMVTYENDTNPKFNAEGVGAKAFRSAVYTISESCVKMVKTEEELIKLLPKLSEFIKYESQ